MAFAVDQQQYLQGYLPIVFLYQLHPVRRDTRRRGADRPCLRHTGQRRAGHQPQQEGHPLDGFPRGRRRCGAAPLRKEGLRMATAARPADERVRRVGIVRKLTQPSRTWRRGRGDTRVHLLRHRGWGPRVPHQHGHHQLPGGLGAARYRGHPGRALDDCRGVRPLGWVHDRGRWHAPRDPHGRVRMAAVGLPDPGLRGRPRHRVPERVRW